MADALTLAPERVRLFGERLQSVRGRTVREKRIWEAFAEVFPEEAQRPSRRRTLVAALGFLEAQGVVELPSPRGRLWDRAIQPPVPTQVRLAQSNQPDAADTSWKRRLWHPALAWVPLLPRVSAEHLEFLERVEQGLIAGAFGKPVPLRTRSLQITGDEKRLGALLRSEVLFGVNRLTLEMLGCIDETVPMAWESVGEGGRVLILENASPFVLARGVLGNLPASGYGLVAWGGGGQALRSIRHLTTIGRNIEGIDYIGDLDARGIEIASGVSHAAHAIGLPRPKPAPAAYQRMLDRIREYGHPVGLKAKGPGRPLKDAERAWLPEDVREAVVTMIECGRRIPEEVLLPEDYAAIAAAARSGVG